MTDKDPDPAPGDWVRVRRNGVLTIAVVLYIHPHRWSVSTPEFETDTAGTVHREEIFEVRKAQP